jgi:outer membrane protein assembly factor BamB
MIPMRTALTILLLFFSLCIAVHAEDALWKCSTQHEISCLELSPDASYIVAGGERIYCMNREGTLLWQEYSGDDLKFIKDGSIIVGLRNNFLHFIDLEGKLSQREEITEDVGISDIIAISDDGTEYFVLGSNCCVFAKDGDEALEERIDHMGNPSCVLMNWNTARIVAIEDDGLHCYSAKSGSQKWEYTARGEQAVMTNDGAYVIYGAGNRIYEISALHGEKGEREELWESRIEGDVLSLDVSDQDDGEYMIAVGTRDATQNSSNNFVYLFDSNGQQKWRKQCGFWVYSIDITPSGNYIAAASLEKKVFLFDRAGNLCKEIETNEPAKFVCLNEEENFGVAADAHNVYAFTLEGATASAEEVQPSPTAPPTSTPTPDLTPAQPVETPIQESKLVDRGDAGDGGNDPTPTPEQESSGTTGKSGASSVFIEVKSALVSFFEGIFSLPAPAS